ncbi:G-D-S-L family lipolytic protein [uncultured Polaribacter sp.]|uniref:G-D-S-L family lipolytic protein n=1 Tax=uncultured Polaribacter sp. TaxID=174711 RepID=UPI00263454B9|nr:G-D-S-L family lipolytic protein [uncultured Polaribacter sp.]
MKNYKYIGLLLLSIGVASCDVNNELDPIEVETVIYPEATSGSADFSNYVALGASFSGGVVDGTLFLAGQESSFPKMMANQMIAMGGGDFIQPLVNDNIGGLTYGGQVIAEPRLYFNGAGPVRLDATPTTETTNKLSGKFNNYGIPGAKSFHMVAPGYGSIPGVLAGTANPYFARMSSSETTTVLIDAVAQGPTFFSISEIGGNDVLSYATSGGTGTVQTTNVDARTYSGNDITSPILFENVMNGMVTALTSNGAKGVIVTVPSIVNLPFFTTVPYNPVPMNAGTAAAVNAGYAVYNGGLQSAFAALSATGLFTQEELDKRTISFAEGQNAVVIVDEDLTDLGAINGAFAAIPKYRQATAEDFLVLTSSGFIGTAVGGNPQLINGVSVPLEDKWVLTPEEKTAIQSATDAYNASITSIANANDLAVTDLNVILNAAASTGAKFDEFSLTTSFVSGGLVSLDGIHLTTRGYGLMANKILESIDAKYGSNFVASNNVNTAKDLPVVYSQSFR